MRAGDAELLQAEDMTPLTELAVLFADIVGSTKLYDKLGNTRARSIIGRAVGLMADATRRNGGRVIKTIGDEVMSVFPGADEAAAAAADMQGAIGAAGAGAGDSGVDITLTIRVGFHMGEVLLDSDDAHGDAVNVAAHVSRLAKPGQIIITGRARSHLSAAWQIDTALVGSTILKGKRDQTEVFELVWQGADMTMVRARPAAPAASEPVSAEPRLILTIGVTRAELGARRPSFTVGRDALNDLVLAESIVSRHHAQVEYRKGRFILTDQSANGTFVEPDSGEGAFVSRDSLVLTGKGRLGLGAPPSPESRTVIFYELG